MRSPLTMHLGLALTSDGAGDETKPIFAMR